jgi:hypothetical protein
MKPEMADCLINARERLDGAKRIVGLPLPQVAAREAYLAAFHAAEAYIFEQTGRKLMRLAGPMVTCSALKFPMEAKGYDVRRKPASNLFKALCVKH